MMDEPFILHGAAYSVYTRICRLVLEETGARYRLNHVDIFAEGGPPADFGDLHPFSKIPVLQHGDFTVYETDAIAGYVLDVMGSGSLLPATPEERARVCQIMRIIDNYGYPSLVWGLYVADREEGAPAAPDALDQAATVLDVLARLKSGTYVCGESVTLADLWLVPVLAYARHSPSAEKLLAGYRALDTWWRLMAKRASVRNTRFDNETSGP